MNNYTIDEINKIILNKKVEDFYFAILQIRKEVLLNSDEMEESEAILESKEKLDLLAKQYIKINGDITEEEMKEYLYNNAAINYIAVVVKIDNLLYDCKNVEFIDLNKTMVVDYENAGKYYNDDNARPVLLLPDETSPIAFPIAFLEMDDISHYINYKDRSYSMEYGSVDKTEEFKAVISLKNKESRSRNYIIEEDGLKY